MPPAPRERVVLHLDMDAFYAAVEVREDPSLRGKPVIIGHRGRRGVVSTCSYEARKFGVRSAMPSVTAERLCPQAVWLPGRMDLYVEVSHRIRVLFDEASPVVEPLSIDEAFLDLTGIAPDLEAGRRIGQKLKDRIRAVERLTASVGVAPNKFLAKLASDLEKPDGLVVFPREDVRRRLHPMPIEKLWGVGPRTGEKLRAAGAATVGALLRVPRVRLESAVGPALAVHVLALARGEDDRPVEPGRETKSVSEERTYAEDLRTAEDIDRALLARAEGVARRLRDAKVVARTVHLKVRTGDYRTWTRARTLPVPTDLCEPILAAARELLRDRIDLGDAGVRLLGVGVSALEPAGTGQGRLFSGPEEVRARRLAVAADALRERFGEDVVRRARLLRKGTKGKRGFGDDEEGPPEASSLGSLE